MRFIEKIKRAKDSTGERIENLKIDLKPENIKRRVDGYIDGKIEAGVAKVREEDEQNNRWHVFHEPPEKTVELLTKNYERRRKTEAEGAKYEGGKEQRESSLAQLKEEHKARRKQEQDLQASGERQRRELRLELRMESNEEVKRSRREQLAKELIEERKSQNPESQQMTLIEEEFPVGFTERFIFQRRLGFVNNAAAEILSEKYLKEAEERAEELAELQSEKEAKREDGSALSEQEKKKIDNRIVELEKKEEQAMAKSAAAFSIDSLLKMKDVITAFVHSEIEQDMLFHGQYEPMKIKWEGKGVEAWEKQVSKILDSKLSQTAEELRNVKKWWQEAEFKGFSYKVGIAPKETPEAEMLKMGEGERKEIMAEYAEKKKWFDLRIEEYAKSQKLALEILGRIDKAIQNSLIEDLEVRNLAGFFVLNPDVGQDWQKVREIINYQAMIEETFRLEIGKQLDAQKVRNGVEQDVWDMAYRNALDISRGVFGPLINIGKGKAKTDVAVTKGLIDAVQNFVTGGFEFLGKEFFLSPIRGGYRVVTGKYGEWDKNKRALEKKEIIRKKSETINT